MPTNENEILIIQQIFEMKKDSENTQETKAINYEPLLGVVLIDAQKDYYDKDELYCKWYTCPKCQDTYVRFKDNYCSNCGAKFEWSGHYA